MSILEKLKSLFSSKKLRIDEAKVDAYLYEMFTYEHSLLIANVEYDRELIAVETTAFMEGLFRNKGITLMNKLFLKADDVKTAFVEKLYLDVEKTLIVIDARDLSHEHWFEFRRYLELFSNAMITDKLNYFYLIPPSFEEGVDKDILETNYEGYKRIVSN